MILSDLLSAIEPLRVIGRTDVDVHAIQFDSRKVEPGDLFVAQAGTAVDGHTFIDACVNKGCSVVILDNTAYLAEPKQDVTYVLVRSSDEALGRLAHQWYGRPSEKLTLVGVTGTNGKTTIATLLYNMAHAMGHKAGLLSTVIYYVDGEAFPSTHTTPDALALNALLAKMVDCPLYRRR